MNEGMENLKEIEALKQQLYTERESLKKEADELMMKKIEHYEKELALVREDVQIEILRLEKRNTEHQKLNGELREEYNALKKANQNLREKIEQYQDKAAHYRRKAVL